jgi:L-rhamnose-H+ transport protein
MDNTIFWGLLLVTLAGFGTGTTAWPIKKIKDFHFEIFLFVFMLTGVILIPWLMVFINIKEPFALVSVIGKKPLIISNLFSISWGIANVIYLACVVKIGAALTGAILSALGMSVGVLMPMLVKGSGLFGNAPDIGSKTGVFILSALSVLLIGVVLISIAGFKREKLLKSQEASVREHQASGNFLQGLLLVVAAGILSSGISLAFVYSQDAVTKVVALQGGGDITANFAVWAFGMLGGGLVNIGYATYLIFRNNNLKVFFERREELLYGAIIGLQFILSIVALGKGMILLGALGASIGFAIQQSMQILGNQVVGFSGGEWKGVKGEPRRFMYVAILIIFIAVIMLAYSQTFPS